MTQPTRPSDTIITPMGRVAAPWLAWPELLAVFDALAAAGHEARVVGGALRDTLRAHRLGQSPPHDPDIDVATTAQPSVVDAAAIAAGLETRPTGISHGTVTILSHHKTFETTTLRSDLNTDGRMAEVVFTQDWLGDAQRRDFTVNAIYCDRHGEIYDPVGGLSDLQNGVIRFIGEPRDRIREDYLRTLRMFRLSAAMPEFVRDPSANLAVTAEHNGLKRLSGERIRKEMFSLLSGPGACDAFDAMRCAGVLTKLLPFAPQPQRLRRTVQIEHVLEQPPDPVLRLVAACIADPGDASRLASRLKLSRLERRAALDLAHVVCNRTLRAQIQLVPRDVLYDLSSDQRERAVVLLHAADGAPPDSPKWQDIHRFAKNWRPPEFPIAARDLIRLGAESGPTLGNLVRDIETLWRKSDFSLERDQLLELAAQQINRSNDS